MSHNHKYRGFESTITKEKEGGYSSISYKISDGWELDSWYNPSIKTKQQAIKECMVAIDDYYNNPQDYED